MNDLIDEVRRQLEELRDTISKIEKEEKAELKMNTKIIEVIFYNIDEVLLTRLKGRGKIK